jgi:hypothetical protein
VLSRSRLDIDVQVLIAPDETWFDVDLRLAAVRFSLRPTLASGLAQATDTGNLAGVWALMVCVDRDRLARGVSSHLGHYRLYADGSCIDLNNTAAPPQFNVFNATDALGLLAGAVECSLQMTALETTHCPGQR